MYGHAQPSGCRTGSKDGEGLSGPTCDSRLRRASNTEGDVPLLHGGERGALSEQAGSTVVSAHSTEGRDHRGGGADLGDQCVDPGGSRHDSVFRNVECGSAMGLVNCLNRPLMRPDGFRHVSAVSGL